MKHQIPYYHPLTDWLLWATIGNYGHSVMDLQWLKAPVHQQEVKQVKICMKHQIPYYHSLTD